MIIHAITMTFDDAGFKAEVSAPINANQTAKNICWPGYRVRVERFGFPEWSQIRDLDRGYYVMAHAREDKVNEKLRELMGLVLGRFKKDLQAIERMRIHYNQLPDGVMKAVNVTYKEPFTAPKNIKL